MGVAYHPPIFTLRCGPYFSNFSANAQTWRHVVRPSGDVPPLAAAHGCAHRRTSFTAKLDQSLTLATSDFVADS